MAYKLSDTDWGEFLGSLGSHEGWAKKRPNMFGEDMQALFGMLAQKVAPGSTMGELGGAFSKYVQGVSQREGENERIKKLWKALSMMGSQRPANGVAQTGSGLRGEGFNLQKDPLIGDY